MINDYINLPLFFQKDPNDQEGILKHNALSVLGGNKSCKAVIIDGQSSQYSQDYFDDRPVPILAEVFKHCDTKFFRVNSSEEFCSSLQKSTHDFGQKLDLLAISGHGLPYLIKLSKNYHLSLYDRQIASCLPNHMQDEAQVVLLSCLTGKRHNELQHSMAEYFSFILPNREILAPITQTTITHALATYSYDKKFYWQEYQPAIWKDYDELSERPILNEWFDQIIRRVINGSIQKEGNWASWNSF